MITTQKQAADLCKKYGVEFSGSVLVTGFGNIYATGEVDPKDTSDIFKPEEGPDDTGDTSEKKNRKKDA